MILQEGMASVGDVQLFYKVGGSGSPVIVLHGGPGMDHHSFLPQFERLRRAPLHRPLRSTRMRSIYRLPV